MRSTIGIIIISSFMFSQGLLAQDSDNNKMRGIVSYKFSHLKDTTKPSVIHSEDMRLYFANGISDYKSQTKKIVDSIRRKMVDEAVRNGGGHISTNSLQKFTPEQIFTDKTASQVLELRLFMRTNYIIKERLPEINWSIKEEVKTIGDYSCQKAEAIFRGRAYTAWFCADLPYNFGPWKLSGLPGLILEAYDNKQHIKFEFQSLELNIPNVAYIGVPKNSVETTHAELEKTINAIRENPSLASNSLGLKVSTPGRRLDKLKKPNNPIELADK
jgi:GLPGLI family protein